MAAPGAGRRGAGGGRRRRSDRAAARPRSRPPRPRGGRRGPAACCPGPGRAGRSLTHDRRRGRSGRGAAVPLARRPRPHHRVHRGGRRLEGGAVVGRRRGPGAVVRGTPGRNGGGVRRHAPALWRGRSDWGVSLLHRGRARGPASARLGDVPAGRSHYRGAPARRDWWGLSRSRPGRGVQVRDPAATSACRWLLSGLEPPEGGWAPRGVAGRVPMALGRPTTTTAAVYHAPGDLRIEEV